MGHIQIRNVPEDVHRTLKSRAAQRGQSLSEYLLAILADEASLPTIDEWLEEVRALPKAEPSAMSGAELVRAEREERERHLGRLSRG